MRVLVLGAGLLGVTSAYYLQQLGHEVTVVDRHATPAAKARGLAPTASTQPPRAAVAAPRRGKKLSRFGDGIRRSLGRLVDRAVGTPTKGDPLDHLVRLAAYSHKSTRALREEAGVSHGARSTGLLNLYTDADAFRVRIAGATHWSSLGCEERLLSADEALVVEPALKAMRSKLAGATYALEDPARDPAQFAASLVFLCRAAGVRFMTRHTVVSLKERDGRIDHVELLDAAGQSALLRGQAYVLALGASSVPHAEDLGIDMPLRFVREYIVTMPLLNPSLAPRIPLRDRQGKLRITRIESPSGDQLRVQAIVQAGLDEEAEPDSDRFRAIVRRTEMLLPGVADATRASFDTAMHASSTNRLPMIGKTRLPNLFLNTAPGTRTWVHACGAGKSIARIVSGLRPELDFAFRRP